MSYATGGFRPQTTMSFPMNDDNTPILQQMNDDDWYGPPRQKDSRVIMKVPPQDKSWQEAEETVQLMAGAEKTRKLESDAYGLTLSMPALLQVKSRQICLSLAILIMFLLLAVPVSNCIALLNDLTYVFMVGRALPGWLLGFCIALFCLSVFTLLGFLSNMPYDRRTPQTMFMMGGVFLSSLGILLVLFGNPIATEAMNASDELIQSCGTGPKSGVIFATFQDLKTIRAQPTCKNEESIEDCAAYTQYVTSPIGQSSAWIAKGIETGYRCSGFCAGTATDGTRIYPPTLFSQSNYKMSCDGAVMRHMRTTVRDLAGTMVVEGAVLVGAAILVSFIMLVGFCTWQTGYGKAGSDTGYGAA